VSFGLATFVALYWIRQLGASTAMGGTTLTFELGGGVLSTFAGGADREAADHVRAPITRP
jgi:FSR family fosmidomycin resistance protein-like MFS transporter